MWVALEQIAYWALVQEVIYDIGSYGKIDWVWTF